MVRQQSLVLVLALYLVWPLYQVGDYISVQPFASVWDMVNYGASILSYNWLLLNVLLGLKIPLVQRLLPYDFRLRAHILSSVLLTVFLVWHASFYLFINPKQITLVTWALAGGFPLMILLSLLWVPLPGLRIAGKFSYDLLKGCHKVLFVVLAGLAYVHVIDAKIIGVASPASSFGFQALFLVTVVAFLYTRLHNRLLPTLEVVEVVTRGSLVQLKLSGHRRPRYRAGQFAFLRFRHPQLRNEEHPFSFTSAAHEDTVEFAIKAVGDFTKKLSVLAPGDKVRVNGGFGAFRPPKAPRPLVFIGTGIGAAPLVSILKDLIEKPRSTPVVCFVAANSRDDLVDAGWWDSLPDRLPGLKLRVLLADEGAPLLDDQLIRSELGDPHRYEYFLCSSSRVRATLMGILGRLNVPARRIHFEEFSFS